jgi:hypothetical protein
LQHPPKIRRENALGRDGEGAGTGLDSILVSQLLFSGQRVMDPCRDIS